MPITIPAPYTPSASDDLLLQALDTLRGLLAQDSLTANTFQGTIRLFPATSAPEFAADGVTLAGPVVSLYSPQESTVAAETLGGSGVGRFKSSWRLTLMVALHERQKFDDATAADPGPYYDGLYRRLINATGNFRRAILKYRSDPTGSSSGRLWHNIEFPKGGGTPATLIDRVPGKLLFTVTALDMHTQRRIP